MPVSDGPGAGARNAPLELSDAYRLTIDNNASERRVRDQAIGRKNWMFLGSAEAGPRAAVLCTVIAGAKRHRLEPWAYLHDVILQLSVDAGPESLARLLPDQWAVRAPQHILSHRLEESRQKAGTSGPASGE